MDPTPLVRDALEAAPQPRDQARVLVADDQLQSGQAALLERGHEAFPEHLVLAVADVEAEDLAPSGCGGAGGDNHGHRGHLRGLAGDVEVGRVEVDVGELDVIQPPGAERFDGLIQPGTDPGDLRLRDPRIDAHRLDEIVHRAWVVTNRARVPLRSVTRVSVRS